MKDFKSSRNRDKVRELMEAEKRLEKPRTMTKVISDAWRMLTN
jgi:hypothetical protein